MPVIRTYKDGALVSTTDDRTLPEARQEAIDRAEQAASSSPLSATKVKARLAAAVTSANAAETNAAADAVGF